MKPELLSWRTMLSVFVCVVFAGLAIVRLADESDSTVEAQVSQPVPAGLHGLLQMQGGGRAWNDVDIVRLVRAGIPDSMVILQIKAHAGNYLLNAPILAKMKELGVSDSVIAAMQAKMAATTPPAGSNADSGGTAGTAPAAPAAPAAPPRPNPPAAAPSAFEALNTKDLLVLDLVRSMPNALDDPEVLQGFIIINNCNTDIGAQLDNEITYPKFAASYKERAPQILAGLPPEITMTLTDQIRVGEYDTGRGAFRLLPEGPNGSRGQFYLQLASGLAEVGRSGCINPDFMYQPGSGIFPGGKDPDPRFEVAFPSYQFAEIPMPETVAEQFINDENRLGGVMRGPTGVIRTIWVVAHIQIAPGPPKLSLSGSWKEPSRVHLQFAGQLKDISIYERPPGVPNIQPVYTLQVDAGSSAAAGSHP